KISITNYSVFRIRSITNNQKVVKFIILYYKLQLKYSKPNFIYELSIYFLILSKVHWYIG
ncbi:hypothetical protein BpHYR1_054045, partial [Brachionus plicatilis]